MLLRKYNHLDTFFSANLLAFVIVFCFIILPQESVANETDHNITRLPGKQPYREGYIYVLFASNIPEQTKEYVLTEVASGSGKKYKSIPDLQLVSLANGVTVEQAIQHLKSSSHIQYVEPDYVIDAKVLATIPNDPFFISQWGLDNIDAPKAWDIQTGDGSCTVAIIDTGIDYAHPDLAANIWVNSGEVTYGIDGIDNDSNGFIDDIRGWDFGDNDNDPTPSTIRPIFVSGHGTGVAGVAGAVGNNGTGIAGVAWNIKIMPLKYQPDDPSAPLLSSFFVNAINYAVNNGALVSNHSYSLGSTPIASIETAINSAGLAGHLVVAAAGFGNLDQDVNPIYPSSYTSSNLIAVTSIDSLGNLFNRYGSISIDLGAPGKNIPTTWQGGTIETKTGTSYATAHVSGAVCLLKMENPSLTAVQIQSDILTNAQPNTDLSGKSTTGGVLNLGNTNTLPVILSHFKSSLSGRKLTAKWGTASEIFNVGFQLWGKLGSDWLALNPRLDETSTGNGAEPQSYRHRLKLTNEQAALSAIGISSVDADGSEHFFGPFNIGQEYGALIELEPIDWSAVRAQMDARMADKGYVNVGRRGYQQATAAGELSNAIEFSVGAEGLYRIAGSELPADWQQVPGSELAVIDAAGEPLVRDLMALGSGRGSARTLGSAGEIIFYASAAKGMARLYSDNQTYRLVRDSAQVRNVIKQGKQGVRSGFSSHYRERVEVEQDSLYKLAATTDDPWVKEAFLSFKRGRSSSQTLSVAPDLLPEQPIEVIVGAGRGSHLRAVDGDGDGTQDDEHLMQGWVTVADGSQLLLDEHGAIGRGAWEERFTLPAGTAVDVSAGLIEVGATFRPGAGYFFSLTYIDYFGLEYARAYVAKEGDNYLSFGAPGLGEQGYEVLLPNKVGGGRVYAMAGGNLVWIIPESNKRLKVDGQSKRRVRFAQLQGEAALLEPVAINYWVATAGGYLGVDDLHAHKVASADDLLEAASGSDYLIVAHPSFIGADGSGRDALAEFAVHKRGLGHRLSVINYLDVVDAFGGGQAGTAGLSRYLAEVESAGHLNYVLLVGGGSYDHKGILQSGALTFIPPYYEPTAYYSLYTNTDTPYVRDEKGELFASIGRWPVRSIEEVSMMVSKQLAWQQSGAGTAVLLAEQTGKDNINFSQALESLGTQIVSDWTLDKIYIDDILADNPDWTVNQAVAHARVRLFDALADKPQLLLFNGHASSSALSRPALISAGDAASLPGSMLWLPLSCYVTYYESTHLNTLAHQLLFGGNAVALGGATSYSDQNLNMTLARGILGGMFGGDSLGGATSAVHQASNNPVMQANWATLGDPALSLPRQ